MTKNSDTQGAEVDPVPPTPRTKVPPIENRFLFVDIAAMRAKQLKRGATCRLDEDDQQADDVVRARPLKVERLAMEEVRRGLVEYQTPPTTKPAAS